MSPFSRSRSYPSSLHLLFLVLTPSGLSGVLCVCFGVFIIGLHILFISLNVGTLLPNLFDGQWAVSYTNVVVQPLQQLFGSNSFNQFLTMLMWSVVGLLVYEAGTYLLRNYRGLREAEHDVLMVGGKVVRHPLRGAFFKRFLWRLGLGVVFFVLLFVLQPVFSYLFTADRSLFNGTPLAQALRTLFLNVLIWALLAHGFVVFVRLYTMRPRLR